MGNSEKSETAASFAFIHRSQTDNTEVKGQSEQQSCESRLLVHDGERSGGRVKARQKIPAASSKSRLEEMQEEEEEM